MYNNSTFFSNFKYKKNGLGYRGFLNVYKTFGLPIFYGKLAKKEGYMVESVCNKFDFYNIRTSNIENLVNIKTLKGIKHIKNHPVNGQRTRVNARTRRFYKRI